MLTDAEQPGNPRERLCSYICLLNNFALEKKKTLSIHYLEILMSFEKATDCCAKFRNSLGRGSPLPSPGTSLGTVKGQPRGRLLES